ALVLVVVAPTRASAATPRGEDTLCRGLRTSPLPGTHASVGDCWQNGRCWHPLSEEQHSCSDTLVSDPNDETQSAARGADEQSPCAPRVPAFPPKFLLHYLEKQPAHAGGTAEARKTALRVAGLLQRLARPTAFVLQGLLLAAVWK